MVIQRRKAANFVPDVEYTANADVKGARNILAAGHTVLAGEGMVQSDHPLKRNEPEPYDNLKVAGIHALKDVEEVKSMVGCRFMATSASLDTCRYTEHISHL